MSTVANRPWYRHFYAWIVVGIPTIAVLASLNFVYLAVKNQDELVPGDWYQDGKAINENVARTQAALDQGVVAKLQMDEGSGEVMLQLTSRSPLPETLSLNFTHATQGHRDQYLTLSLIDNGRYIGHLARPLDGLFNIDLSAQQWQILHEQVFPMSSDELTLGKAQD